MPIWLGFRPRVLTYTRQKRLHGTSRYTFKKKLLFFIGSLTGFSMTPIRMLSAFGLVVALLSFLYGLSTFIAALAGGVPVRGFPALVVLITFFSGLILIMLGAMGEYLWRVLDAVNKRPEAVIDETFL